MFLRLAPILDIYLEDVIEALTEWELFILFNLEINHENFI